MKNLQLLKLINKNKILNGQVQPGTPYKLHFLHKETVSKIIKIFVIHKSFLRKFLEIILKVKIYLMQLMKSIMICKTPIHIFTHKILLLNVLLRNNKCKFQNTNKFFRYDKHETTNLLHETSNQCKTLINKLNRILLNEDKMHF